MGTRISSNWNGVGTEPDASTHLQDRSLQHDAYALIVDWIHDGVLKPGDKLNEAAIATALGVSRGPVREAIQRLDREGLVVRRPRRGAFIPELSAQEVEDIVDTRQLIEGHAARRATQRITPADLDELERLIARMETVARSEQWTETVLLNARFHETVVRVSGSPTLLRLWKTLHPLTWLLARSVATSKKPHNVDSLVKRHRTLIDALRSGDGDLAEAAFRHHVEESGHRRSKAIERNA